MYIPKEFKETNQAEMPKVTKKTGKTIDGYSPAKLAIRAQKRGK